MNTFDSHNILSTALLLLNCAVLSTPGISVAAECAATSGPHRVALLELYTSEGCDSCPAADKWVSELPARKFTVDRVIPLAFHVDYWNHLGWTDPFSQAAFSRRQRAHSNRRGVGFVVTPQLLLNGEDFRRGSVSDNFSDKIRAINLSKAQAEIRLKVSHSNDVLVGALEVRVGGDAETRRADVYLALYENNLVTAVSAGENNGRLLKHDFVVRTLVGPLALDDTGNLSRNHRFELDRRWKPQDINLAAFIQHRASGDVVQAVAARCS